MTVDPKLTPDLDATDAALNAVTTAAAQGKASLAHLRTLLDQSTPPVPPTDTPISIVKASASRKDTSTITVSYTLAGTLSRADQVGGIRQGGAPTEWQSKPLTTSAPDNTVDLSVPANTSGNFFFQVHDSKLATNNGWVPVSIPYSTVGQLPPPPPGSGKFSFGKDTAGNTVFLQDAKVWTPLGVNVPGPNGYWGGGFTPMGKANRLKQSWGWNFIRLFEQSAAGGECSACPSAHNSYTIQQVVDEYTAAGFVVMIDWHQYDFGRVYGPTQTAEMISVWTNWANQFKNNPLVWFELANEPESSYGVGGIRDDNACYDRWYNAFAPVVKAIRATGATNMIVVNDAQAGQGCCDFWSMKPSEGSAIMARGAQLLAQDPTGNMCWDVHVYDAFGWLAVNEQNNDCSQRYTNAQRDARLTDYVKRVWQATGRPIFAGEFGWQVGETTTSGSGFHYPYTQCGSRTRAAQEAFTRAGKALGMGGTQWPGFQLCTNGNDAYDANSLTECGRDWFNYCQAMRAATVVATTATVDIDPSLDRLHTLQMTQPQRNSFAALAEVSDPSDPEATVPELDYDPMEDYEAARATLIE